jgi:hypothetical protein
LPLTKVTAGVIAANAVVDSFGSQSITGDKLGLTAINANNIVDGTITAAKLAPGTALSNGQLSVVTAGLAVIPDSPATITPYKILGQVQVGGSTFGNTTTNVYVVPASTQTVVKTIAITNQSANTVSVDFFARLNTQALSNQHYLVRSFNLTGADTLLLEPNITMNASSILAANIIGANANTSNVTVNAFGVEII